MLKPGVHVMWYRMLICGSGLICLQAWAADAPTVSPAMLAAADATTEFCAKANPAAADRYGEQAKVLLHGVSKDQLAEIRAGSEYRRAYDAAMELIAKGSPDEAVRACVDSLTNP